MGSIPLGRAWDALDAVTAALSSLDGVAWMAPAGSVRRVDDLVSDITLVVATDRPDRVLDALASTSGPGVRSVGSVDRTTPGGSEDPPPGTHLLVTVDRMAVHVHCAAVESAGAVLLYDTGNAAHVEALRARAERKGHRLDASGLHTADRGRVGSSEEAIYAALDLPFVPPELRDGEDELRLAEEGRLPVLITTGDMRGDLHMHSSWSDGQDAIEAMVVTAIGLGYEYIAITDHSPSSAASRNLTTDGVSRQAEEIGSLRQTYPQIAILHGCEVDILEDGSLDFPDHVIERFDLVLASLHDRHDHDPATLLSRYERAMRHPLVTIITHPTNRMVPHRAGYELDYDRLFALAVETGTVLEIDGAPSHLDLDAALARRAVDAGVTLSIDSDCHRASRLGRQMQLGVGLARRGRVEARHVLNTRPLAVVQAHIAAKRASASGRTVFRST